MIPQGVQVFVALDPVDLRCSFDRLAGIAQEQVGVVSSVQRSPADRAALCSHPDRDLLVNLRQLHEELHTEQLLVHH